MKPSRLWDPSQNGLFPSDHSGTGNFGGPFDRAAAGGSISTSPDTSSGPSVNAVMVTRQSFWGNRS